MKMPHECFMSPSQGRTFTAATQSRNEGEPAAMRMHQNASDRTAAEREARVVKQSTDARAPPGPKMTNKSMAFINGVLICGWYMTTGICRTSTIKTISAKLAACQSQQKAAKGVDFGRAREDFSGAVIWLCWPEIAFGRGDKIPLDSSRRRSAVQSGADESVPGCCCRLTRPL